MGYGHGPSSIIGIWCDVANKMKKASTNTNGRATSRGCKTTLLLTATNNEERGGYKALSIVSLLLALSNFL
jgi:hypothetical protein